MLGCGMLAGAQSIAQYEYFFDIDPGVGNATAIAASPNAGDLTESIAIPTSGVTPGFHDLYIRAMDDTGVWSHYANRRFYVSDPSAFATPPADALAFAQFAFDAQVAYSNGSNVSLNGTTGSTSSGNAVLTPSMTPDVFTASIPTTGVDCGITEVALYITDVNSTDSLYEVATSIDIQDAAAPTIISQPLTISLDANGMASLTANDLDNGTTDDCTLMSLSVDTTSFDCSDIGNNAVTLTATDAENKVSTATQTVTIVDDLAPVAAGQNITRDLNGAASITIPAADVDNGSTDNCSVSFSLSPDTFTMTGVFPATFTVTDPGGNTDSTSVTITITDSTLGLDDVQRETQIMVYPNPTNGAVNIITNLEQYDVAVYDITGRQVMDTVSDTDVLDLQDLSPAVYLLRLTAGSFVHTQQIVLKQ